MITNLSTAPV